MKVLVTGALGYLGGRIVQAMAGRPGSSLRIMVHGMGRIPAGFPAVEVRRGDVRDRESIRGICEDITHVIHLAGLDQPACQYSPAEALLVSGIGTLHMAEEAVAAGVHRFLFLSTIHVYGQATGGRLQETAVPRPMNPYGISRLAGEGFARLTSRGKGLSVVILRLSNGYGPPAFPGTSCWQVVINDLCRQAVRAGKIVLRGSGKDARDFVAVSDVIRAIQLFANVPDISIGDDIVNIGGENLRTILNVAECIRDVFKEQTGQEVPIYLGSGPDPKSPPPIFDISCARRFGFAPQVDFREEIRRTLSAAAGPLAGETS